MKILVTGGLGFIGSNFILRIIKKFAKWKIINLDAELAGSNKKNLIDIQESKNYEFVKGNINNKNLVNKLVSKVDYVINFAAETHVDRSINNPKPFLDSNFLGVFTILEAVMKYKKTLIQISTDEVFGSLAKKSADEKFPFNPSSPYASSKACAELLVNSYVKTYGCKAIITRCTNNYGPRQAFEKLIPKTITLAKENQKIPIFGNGKNIRDWIFVDDHCNAILRIMKKGKIGSSYNISASSEIDNLMLVKKILKLMNRHKNLIKFTKDRPGHDFRYSLDSSKIKKELKWRPELSLEDGIKKTISWYLENKRWSKSSLRNLSNVKWKTR